ncbi:hypothetical protein ABPG74_019260 [Tetrahymena malaccensis]
MNKSIQILEKQNNSTYFVIYSQLDRGSQQLDIPLDIIECTDPELIGFNCLDFSQLQNQTLSLNDQKNIYSRIQIGYTSCYQVINEINCASQEETDQVVTNGVLHIKTLSQQYNTTSQKIQINYKNYFANLQPNSTFEKTYDIIKQQTTIIQGAFYQSEQQFSSPVSLEFSNSQTYNYLGLLIVLNFQPSQEIQYIKIQYSSIPEILSSCNGFLTMAMAIGIFARYISSNLLKQDLFLIILQNMYQSTYQLMVMKSNIQLNSKGEIQQIKSKISKIEQKTKKKKKDKECEQQENNNQFNNIEKIQKSQLCCFHIKKKTNNKKITKINQEFNQMQDIITKSEVVKLPSTQQKYNEKDIQNTQIIRKDAINTTIDLQNKDQEGNFLLFNKDKNVLTQFQILQGKSNQNLRVNEKKIEEDQGSLILNSNMTSSQLALNQHSFQFAHSEVCQQFDVKDIENSIQIPCFQTQYIDNSVKKPNRKQENQKNTQFQSTSFLIPNQTLLNPQNFNNQVTNFLMNPSSPELKTQDLTIKDDQNNNKVNQLIKSHKIVSSLSNQKNQNLQNQFLKNQHQDGNSDINSDQCYNNRIFNQYEHINNYHMSNLNQFPLKSIQDQDTQDVDKNDKKLDDQKTFEKKQSKQNSVDQLQLDNQQSKINEVAQTNNSENKISSKQNKDSQKNERGQKHIQQANLLKNSQTCQQDFEQLEQQQQIQNKAFVINANSDEKQIEKQRYLFSDPIKNYIKNIIFKLKQSKQRIQLFFNQQQKLKIYLTNQKNNFIQKIEKKE